NTVKHAVDILFGVDVGLFVNVAGFNHVTVGKFLSVAQQCRQISAHGLVRQVNRSLHLWIIERNLAGIVTSGYRRSVLIKTESAVVVIRLVTRNWIVEP